MDMTFLLKLPPAISNLVRPSKVVLVLSSCMSQLDLMIVGACRRGFLQGFGRGPPMRCVTERHEAEVEGEVVAAVGETSAEVVSANMDVVS